MLISYKRQRNLVKSLVRKAKRSFFQKLVDKDSSTGSIWKALRSVTQGCQPHEVPSSLSADKFNSHFISVADIINNPKESYVCSDKLREYCEKKIPYHETFKIPHITVEEVYKYITATSNKKSVGVDGLSGYILKLSLPYTIETLTHIYNICIQNQIFPDKLKVAKVIPLPKGNDLTDPNNYRPISVLSIISKPLEKHIHTHLLRYLDRFTLLRPSQSGYRPNHSCQTALAHMTNNWLYNINNCNMTGAVFLDLRKAFDLIDHDILLQKLSVYLKDFDSLSFFKSYLENRQQCVFAHGKLSSCGHLQSGVPQGSVLGPLLFCLYINDLPLHITNLSTSCDMFADDTTLYTAGSDVNQIQSSLQSSLQEVSSWCHLNRMLIHPQKTKCMLISTRQQLQNLPPPLSLSIGSSAVEQVSEHRVLGVLLDDRFQWEAYTDQLCKKLSQNLFLLSKLKHFVDVDTRKLFFNAHIKSQVDYVSSVWDNCAENHFLKVNSLYRRSAKLILPDPSLSTDEKMTKLGILPLEKQLAANKSLLMYKIYHCKAPVYLRDLFAPSQIRYETSRFDIRSIKPKWPRIDLTKTSFAYSGALLWNSLPVKLKFSPSITSFKKSLHDYFMTARLK